MFEASLLGYPICEASVGASSFSRASTFVASVQDRPARILVLWSLCVSDTGFTAEVSREGLRLSNHPLLIQDRDWLLSHMPCSEKGAFARERPNQRTEYR